MVTRAQHPANGSPGGFDVRDIWSLPFKLLYLFLDFYYFLLLCFHKAALRLCEMFKVLYKYIELKYVIFLSLTSQVHTTY